MLRHTVQYTNFSNEKVSAIVHFNLTETELLELENKYKDAGGFFAALKSAHDNADITGLTMIWMDVVLTAYGTLSNDGEYFEKPIAARERFASSAAFNAVFLECLKDGEKGAAFINAVFPKDLVEQGRQLQAQQDKPTGPPPVPATVVTTLPAPASVVDPIIR